MEVDQPKDDRKSLPTRGLKGSPLIWLQEKRERDAQLWGVDTSNLWIVQNKLYDLNSFVDSHPGGKNWLTMTKGQDITEFFIVHHLNQEKVREVLKKYYVSDTKNSVSRYSFAQNGLYRTIKRQVLKQIPIAEIQSQTKTRIYAFIILALLLLGLFMTAKSINLEQPSNLPYLYGAGCSMLLVAMIGVGHNFVHHKENAFKYFFLISGFTHDQWQIMHCLSHHLYPNLDLDYQAAALQPLAFFLRNKPKNKVYTQLIVILIFIFLQPLNFLLKTVLVPILKKKRPDFWYLVPMTVFLTFYVACGSVGYALKLHLFVYCLFGFIYNRVLLCGHRPGQVWSEGAQRIQDFGQHTILATNDTDVWVTGFFSLLFLGGLNIHTAHHLFPTADLCSLPQILQIIKTVCKQKGVKQTFSNRLSCFASITKGIIDRPRFIAK